jgi:hypothetical protein
VQALAMLDAPNPPQAKHVRYIGTKNICELHFGAVILLSMRAPRKRFKQKRDPGLSFGELVQRLWQPESEEPEPKAARATKKQSAGTPARIRKK